MSFKTQLLVEEIRRSNKVLLESTCKGLSVEQERVVRNIYNEFVPLIEATLTPDQIKQIFTSAEQSATAAGTNRSGLGKAVDVAKLPVQAVQKVNDIINKAGQWAQNTKPVQAFDQKFEDLKAKISAKFPNLAQNLTQAGEWAKANPGKTAVIIGVLTAVASLAGGPMGGAIAGQILRGTAELMKGEKLSTAVGKGVKTAVMGFLAGKAIEFVKDNVISNIVSAGEKGITDMEAAMKAANYEDAVAGIDPEVSKYFPDLEGAQTLKMSGNINAFRYNYDVILTPEQQAQFNAFRNQISQLSAPKAGQFIGNAFSPEVMAKQIEMHDWLTKISTDPVQNNLRIAADALKNIPKNELTTANLDQLIGSRADLESKVNALKSLGKGAEAAVQGAIAAADKNKQAVQQSIQNTPPSTGQGSAQGQQNTQPAQPQPTPESLTVSDIDKIFEHIENIYELHRIKTLSNVNEGVFDKLKQVGANLTTKITADKLMKAWQAAGSPTDSDAVEKILRDAGVDDSIITSTYQSMNIAPSASGSAQPATPASAPAASGSAQPATPASAPAASGSAQTLTVGQINKALAKLKLRDLQSIQKLLNDTLAKKSQQPITP